ncbi:alpha/beta hydrolase [Kallotenue papyrolyticum]|uniref:alpha/beta hydrolase n=1 Tax=Kallotenue papyrolyticum TaxID=1325125 RepID=UPI000492D00D|nr:alpha/beta hydrolase [Kallotenue papyrolyticum]
MQHTTHSFTGARNLRIVYDVWQPLMPARAGIALVHGYGEHVGRYQHVITALVKHGYLVYAHDQRGHGRSAGLRAYVDRFDEYVDDLEQLVGRIRAAQPHLPLFVAGHSMGGLIATLYALRAQAELAGLALSAPALIIGADVPPLLKRLSTALARIVPRLPIVPATRSPESVLSRDPEVQRRFDSDPLCYHGRVRPRMGYEFMQAGLRAQQRLHELRLPLLVMYGACDTFVSGAELLYERAQSPDKTLKVWPECRHEIFNEPERNAVIAYLLSWLDARTTGGQVAATEPVTARAPADSSPTPPSAKP